MIEDEKDWRKIVRQAKHYKAIGSTEAYLSRKDEAGYPWEFVTAIEPGGSHRMDISTDVWVRAVHPSGLTFRWSVDIEDRDANGQGSYKIAVARMTKVMGLLPVRARAAFAKYLSDCADAVEKRGTEYADAASKQFRDALALRNLALTR